MYDSSYIKKLATLEALAIFGRKGATVDDGKNLVENIDCLIEEACDMCALNEYCTLGVGVPGACFPRSKVKCKELSAKFQQKIALIIEEVQFDTSLAILDMNNLLMLIRSAQKLMPWKTGLAASFDTILEALSVLSADCYSLLDTSSTNGEGTCGEDPLWWGGDVVA